MAKWTLILLSVYLAAVLNNVVAPLIAVREVTPDFLALLVVVSAVCARDSYGITAAGLAGALADINAPGRLGPGMAIFVVSSAVLSATRRFTHRRPLIQSLATWLAVSATLAAVALARSLFGESTWSLPSFVSGGLAAGLYTALVSLPCYWIFARLDRLRAVAY
jgi:rod shape-determining protein MreD